MSKRPFTSSGPVPVSRGPQGVLSFYEGQTLEHEQTGARVLVLQAFEGGQKALLFPLDEPGRAPFEANASWTVGWDDACFDGPRMVELHRRGSGVLWSAYVPHFDAAVELWRYYRGMKESQSHDLGDECFFILGRNQAPHYGKRYPKSNGVVLVCGSSICYQLRSE